MAKEDRRPPRIGLTGGIASGKSTVAEMFAELGVPVIDTDLVAREVVRRGEPALAEIRDRFGPSVIAADGSLDRKAMRALIFSDPGQRKVLEAILHPRIMAATLAHAGAADGPYQLIVVPLLTTSKLRSEVDRVLVVDCSEETQIERLLARDTESPAQARRMLAAQASREDRLAIADDIVENEGDLGATRAQVLELDRFYRRL